MNMSVRYKVLALIAVTIVVSLAGYVILLGNVREMEARYVEETKRAVESRIETEAEKINTYMAVMQDAADSIATAGEALLRVRQATGEDIEAQVRDFLESAVAKYPTAVGSGLWFEPNVFFEDRRYYGPYAYWDSGKIAFTMDYNTAEYDYHKQDWYTQAIPADWNRRQRRDARVYWSAPYQDSEGTNALMITVGGILYGPDGAVAGMSTLDVSMEDLRRVVGDIRVTESSLAFAVDTRYGLIAAYPADNARLLKPVSSLPFSMEADRGLMNLGRGQSTQFTTQIEGVEHLVFYSVTQTGMGLGIAVPAPELFAQANALMQANTWTTAGVIAALLLLAGVILVVLNAMVIRPILALSGFSRAVADGNLDASIQGSFHSEFGVLRGAMVSMVASLKEKMHEAEMQAQEARASAQAAESARAVAEEATRKAESAKREGMHAAAQRLQGVVEVVSSASTELSAQIDESSRGAEAQSERVAETASAMEEMSASVMEIARNAEATATLSEESRQAAQAGAEQFSVVLRDVGAVNNGFMTVYGSVEELSRKADGIGMIAQTIEDIADQTNLLALNAAIEAARAGDAGRGFAVVADEVRKLAEKTMTATKEVGQSISAIQQAVRETLGGMDKNKGVLAQSMEGMGKAEELLGRIVSFSLKASDQVRAIATAAEQQSSATEEISNSIEDVNRISSETADAMREASRAVAELSEQAGELKKLIAELEGQ